MKRELPLLITGAMGIFLIVQSFIPHPPFNELDRILNDFALIVMVFTMILGLLNLLYGSLRSVTDQKAGWGYAAVTILAFLVTAVFGFFNPFEGAMLKRHLLEDRPELLRVAALDLAESEFGLKGDDARLAARMVARWDNPGLPTDTELLGRSGVAEADVLMLFRYGRLRPEPYARIFEGRNLDRKGFESLRKRARQEAGAVLSAVLPFGRAIQDWAVLLQETLVDNHVFTEVLLRHARGENLKDNGEIRDAARLALDPLLSGEMEIGGKRLDLENLGEIVFAHLLREGCAAVEGLEGRGDAARVGDAAMLRVFGSRRIATGIFAGGEETKASRRAAASLAVMHLNAGALSPERFRLAVEDVFGLSGSEARFHLGPLEKGSGLQWIYDNIYDPLSSTMFALLAFFIASAAYRAFRARSSEAALLLFAGFVVMLGQIPFGNWLTAFLPEGWRMSDLADWIMTYPNMAAQRAIMIGVALGVVATALKIILGLERGYLGGGDD